MRLTSRIFLGALLACVCAGVAGAETPETEPALDATAFAAITNLQLDAAFERSTFKDSDRYMLRQGRPTTMDCDTRTDAAGLETCTVTAPQPRQQTVVPAALAQR